MKESRRVFLGLALGMAAASAARAQQMIMPSLPQENAPPYPGFNRPRVSGPTEPRRDPKAELKANQEHIRKNAARLSQLVAELQKGLQDDDTTKVLSMGVIRKTEEIEKLARQIRDLLRGW